MKTRWCHYYGKLSSRLLLTTALWVTFMVAAIGYTMALSWQIETSARAQGVVAGMSAQIYRANLLVDSRFSEEAFERQLLVMNNSLESIGRREVWKFFTDQSAVGIEAFDREWKNVIMPLLTAARATGTPVASERIEQFVKGLDRLQETINQKRKRFLQIQSRLQGLLMTLAVASLFVIMFFLTHWVIRPTEKLGEGLSNVCEGKLDTRIFLDGSTEFQTISAGFNRMTERLEGLVNDLEGKVREKTMAVEEKNRNLAQLYAVTNFLSRQHSIDELCEGFTSLVMQCTSAAACAIFLFDRKRDKLELAASADLPAHAFGVFSLTPLAADSVTAVLKSDLPLRMTADTPEDFLPQLRLESEGLATAYVFHVRNANKDVGLYVLYFKEEVILPAQTYRLYETFGSNMGTAIANLRLIERDQQYAVVQERTLMAQGLHDSIAQSLSFLNLQVQILESALKSQDTTLTNDTVSQIKAGVQESYEDVRELLLNFRERLHKESFSEGIATVIDRFESQTGLKVHLTQKGSGTELTDKQKLQVIFIMQEALANVRKHSRATKVKIDIHNYDDFVLTVSDNGVGIDQEILLERSKRHVGLNIMRERAARIGAQVTVGPVDSALFRSGTTVRLEISGSQRREGAH